MNNKLLIKNISLFVFILILLPLLSFAATSSTCPEGSYQFETGVPFFAGQGECVAPSNLSNMIISLIHKLFPIAGVLGFAMIIWAGFEYATSGGDTNKQKDAQDRIANAIIGILLLFSFWLIINIINPDILKIQDLTITPVNYENNNINYNIDNIDTSGNLNAFIITAKNFAAGHQVNLNCKNYTSDPNITNYVNYLERAHYNCTWGMSCDHYIATAMRASNLDPSYLLGASPDQYYYAATHPDKYSCFNVTDASTPERAGVQNGDILFFSTEGKPVITNSMSPTDIKGLIGHTALWIDNCRWQASLDDYLPNKRDSQCWWYDPSSAKVIAICRHK
ncbi:MAG: pilin [Minisyncoccia bacterium]